MTNPTRKELVEIKRFLSELSAYIDGNMLHDLTVLLIDRKEETDANLKALRDIVEDYVPTINPGMMGDYCGGMEHEPPKPEVSDELVDHLMYVDFPPKEGEGYQWIGGYILTWENKPPSFGGRELTDEEKSKLLQSRPVDGDLVEKSFNKVLDVCLDSIEINDTGMKICSQGGMMDIKQVIRKLLGGG